MHDNLVRKDRGLGSPRMERLGELYLKALRDPNYRFHLHKTYKSKNFKLFLKENNFILAVGDGYYKVNLEAVRLATVVVPQEVYEATLHRKASDPTTNKSIKQRRAVEVRKASRIEREAKGPDTSPLPLRNILFRKE